jgi:hypothetical protein
MRWPIDRKEIGWLEQCRCESGLILKNCCINFVRHPHMPFRHGVGVYLMLGMLWPKPAPEDTDVVGLVRPFRPIELVNSLARINVYFNDDVFAADSAVEISTLKHLLTPLLYRKVKLWFDAKYVQRLVHRLTLPALLQLVLSRSDEAEGTLPVDSNADRLGPLFLAVNHVIEDDYQDALKAAKAPPEKKRVLYASIYRQGFFSHKDDFESALGRSWQMLMHGVPAVRAAGKHGPFDFHAEFKAAFSMTVVEMFTFGFGVLAHYTQGRHTLFADGSKFVIHRDAFQTAVAPEHLPTSRRIFDYLGLPWHEHVRIAKRNALRSSPTNMYQLFEFFNHPIAILPEGGIIALDVQFMRNRITEGAFWALFDHLRASGREVGPIKEAFGHVTEWYVRALFLESSLPAARVGLCADLDGQITATNCSKPDFVLREGNTLYFIEVTTSAITPFTAASGDWKHVQRELRRIWFGTGHKTDSAKLIQLANAIEAHKDGRLVLAGVAKEEVTRYVPVFVSLRHLPQWPVLMTWYREIMLAGGLPDWFAKSVKFLDLGETEELIQLKGNGDSWTSLFEAKQKFDHPDISVHNFLTLTGRAKKRHPLIIRGVEEATTAFRRIIHD